MTVMGSDLTYNIVEAQLTGSIDGVHINARAVSGGRAGSKLPGVQQYFLANNPFATRVKARNHVPGSVGGTLPMGRYTLRMHEKRANMIRLDPDSGTQMHGRDGLLIHGRGPRGSDGCIVPGDFNIVLNLCKLVQARAEKGLPRISLSVVATGTDVDKKLREWTHTA